MAIQFIPKPHPLPAIPICDELFSFVCGFKDFLEPTITVLGIRRFRTSNIIRVIETVPSCSPVLSHYLLSRFVSLLNMFYDVDDNIVGDRRGKFLELIGQRMGAYTLTGEYSVILEANAYINGNSISDHDADIVFQNDDVDVVECKSCLRNWLPGNPLPRLVRAKLNFLKEIMDHVGATNHNCSVYLLTYLAEDALVGHILRPAGFGAFIVKAKPDILGKLCV